MVECKILPNGDLEITADAEAREYIADHLESSGFWGVLGELFEPFLTNGSYEPFDAGDANPFVGLTSAPCIAESMSVDDDGTRTIDGRCWWYPSYMVADPLDDLRDTGRTVFTLAAGE